MKIIAVTIFLTLSLIEARPQNPADGKYYPQLFKHDLGYWQPDDRGQYKPDGRGAGVPGSGGGSQFGSSGSRFGSSGSSRFTSAGGSQFGNNKFSQTGSRGSFGGLSNGLVSGSAQQSSFGPSGSQFASSSFQNSPNSNNAIAAIGISSSFLPPLAEDSEEFAGFSPDSGSPFTSSGGSSGGSFGGSNGGSFGGSSGSSGNNLNGNRLSSSTTSFNNAGSGSQGAPIRPTTAKTTTSFGPASSRLSQGGSSKSAANGNGFVKGLGNRVNGDGDYKILRQEGAIDEDGYHYLYETENQINAEETGRLVNKGRDDAHIEATGFFEYVGPDGITYRVDYTADENGFNPVGDHLPTPPPIPEAIQKALDAQGLSFP